jgi:hypothetical protein
MSEHASRFAAPLYDQFEDEHQVADWGGDELFTRMPRRRAVDDAPAPRFGPAPAGGQSSAPPARRPLALVESPEDSRRAPMGEARSGPRDRPSRTGDQAMRERAERLGLSVVEQAGPRFDADEPVAPSHRFDESGAMIEAEPASRRTKVITGHPGGAPRPLPTVRSERRRPTRTPAEWIGPRPERIVGWAFALGLILILIAITTADAATV